MYEFKNLSAIPMRDLSEIGESEKGLEKIVLFKVMYSPTKSEIGSFCLAPMPGCCGVVVSTGSYITPLHRGYMSENFHDLKEYVAKMLGYSCMLATTNTSNFPEVIGAAKHGWKLHNAFTNKRTGNQLTVMEKHI